MPTYRLDVAYDGSGFHGFARQRGLRTVQGEIEGVLARLARAPVETTGAGRTDRGVHARRQVVSFALPVPVEPRRIVRAVTGLLGPEVAARDAAIVPDGFSARFSATWREYRYFVIDGSAPDPLRRHTTWQLAEPLDVVAMAEAAALFVGEHDFSSFCRASGRSCVRRVLAAGWSREADVDVFTVRATAFCHQMVRSLVGFLVEVGRGKHQPSTVPAVLAARDRAAAGPVAPACGLVLWDVGYDIRLAQP